MFKTAYQGGTALEIFSAQDKKLLKIWKPSATAKKVFDKEIKGYVYDIDGIKGQLKAPADDKATLYLSKLIISVTKIYQHRC
jgi:hypothetical protein